jgi:hypothetical protein
MQWLGEVAALEESLRHIAKKKRRVELRGKQNEMGEAGVEVLS